MTHIIRDLDLSAEVEKDFAVVLTTQGKQDALSSGVSAINNLSLTRRWPEKY